MNTKITPIVLETSGHMPVENISADQLDCINRVIVGAIAGQAQDSAVARNGASENDGAFQSFMGRATEPKKSNKRALAPCPKAQEAGAVYPKSGTQAARFLAALLSGKRINPLVGWTTLGIYRLSDTALQLRKRGWPVITGVLVVKNKFGDDCKVANYYMSPDAIELVDDPSNALLDAAAIREAVA